MKNRVEIFRRLLSEKIPNKNIPDKYKVVKAAVEPAKIIELPAIGEAIKNINTSPNEKDPIVMEPEKYPEWIWKGVGKCRAAMTIEEKNQLCPLKSLESELRTRNRREIIARNSQMRNK